MEPTLAPAAPAQPAASETPQTQPASHAAVASGDTSAYREARRAERAGKPLPDVSVTPGAAPAPSATPAAIGETPPPAAPAPQVPPVSNRQQKANDAIRDAVERATADLRAENDRLRRYAPAAPAPPAAPAAPAEPAWKRIAAMPDAPKLEQFDGPNALSDHAAAMSMFVNETLQAEAHTRASQDQLTQAQHARVEAFGTRLNEAKASDPEFVNKLTPEVRALKPFDALLPGERGGPLNIVAEQIFDSPIAPKVLLHLSQHPEDLAKFSALPPHIAAMPPGAREKAHIQHIVKEFGRLEARLETPSTPAPATPQPKTLTDAPAPAPILGGRPAEAADPMASAIRRGDTRAFRELRRQERAAAHRR